MNYQHVERPDIDDIEFRLRSWEHRGPQTWDEMGQLIREYKADVRALVDFIRICEAS